MFSAIIGCVASLYGGYRQSTSGSALLDAQRAAWDMQRQSYEQYRASMMPYMAQGAANLPGGGFGQWWPPTAQTFRAITRHKCDSCGSREFVEHHGQSVCAYCRSGA